MKKYLILTSVLALTACATGGISSVGEYTSKMTPIPRSGAEKDNQNVVGDLRASIEVEVEGDEGEVKTSPRLASYSNSVVRSSPVRHDGKNYMLYDLSDVNFNMADEAFGGTVGFDVDEDSKTIITGFYVLGDKLQRVDGKLAYVKNDIEDVVVKENKISTETEGANITDNKDGTFTYEGNGKIGVFIIDDESKPVQLYEGEYRERGGVEYAVRAFERQDDTSDFNGKIKTDNGEAEATLHYHSKAAELIKEGNALGLEYSDFGYFQLDGDVDRPVSFITGYDDAKKIVEDKIETTVNFKGYAVGSVTAIKDGPNSGKVLALDAPATLIFNAGEGTSTLTASFKNWYDIQYTKEGGKTGTVAFSKFKEDADQQYEFLSNTSNPIAVSGEDIRYFGDNVTPTEAVGLIQVRDCGGSACDNNDYDNHDEVRMNLSFGGKATAQ